MAARPPLHWVLSWWIRSATYARPSWRWNANAAGSAHRCSKALIVGRDEWAADNVTIRNMVTGD
jgi:hypothetical protein